MNGRVRLLRIKAGPRGDQLPEVGVQSASLGQGPGTGEAANHRQEVRHERHHAVSAGGTELLTGSEAAPSVEVSGSEREIAARSPMQLFWRRLRQDRLAMVALGFVVLIVLVAILAPLIVKI